MSQKFYYFGFGSNMLSKRIHINNPSAERVGPGRLDNYRLEFFSTSKMWFGAPATIMPAENAHVYGAIWRIDVQHMNNMDTQEGVDRGVYMPTQVQVHSLNTDEVLECRAYYLHGEAAQALRELEHAEHLPLERRPSITYLKTMVKGAVETGLPQDYIDWLRSLKHNGRMVDVYERKFDLQMVHLVPHF